LKNYKLSKKIKTCNNNCIFCFVKQLPKNLRSSLYVKDDDYMLSYMYGNFITLTNVTADDLNKIIKYRLEPLYISVHSMNENIRTIIFGNKKNMSGLDNLKILDRNGIKTNIQIVLCHGINDGNNLADTLFILLNDLKNMLSIGIVPVGITGFNNNYNLKPYKRKSALRIIDYVNNFKKDYKSVKDSDNIYLSDEFYILAGVDFPEYEYYGNFYQIENGIGKSTDFLKQVEDYLKYDHIPIPGKFNKNRKYILIVTSEYGEAIISNALKIILEKFNNIGEKIVSYIKILEIENKFFGGNIKITGLLSGKDIISKLSKEDMGIYEKILIPSSIFNEENLTIDNYARKDIEIISNKIKIISEKGTSFIKELTF